MDTSFGAFSGSLDDLALIDEHLKVFLEDLDSGVHFPGAGDAQMAGFADFPLNPAGGGVLPAEAEAQHQGYQTGPTESATPSWEAHGMAGSSMEQLLGLAAPPQASWDAAQVTSSPPVAPMAVAGGSNPGFSASHLQLPAFAPATFSRTITTGVSAQLPLHQHAALPTQQPLASQPQPQPSGWPPATGQQLAGSMAGTAAAASQVQAQQGAGSGPGPGRKRKPSARKDPHKAKQEELTSQIQAMMAQLELLQSENDRLRMRHQVLEHVVEESGEHVKTLAAQRGQVELPVDAVAPAASTSSQQLPGVAAADVQRNHGSALLQLLSQAAGAGSGGSSGGSKSPSTLESLPPETFALQWKAFLTEVSAVLLRCDGPSPDSEAVAEVRRMVQGVFSSISKEKLIINSNILLQYHCRNLETQVSEDVDEAHWVRAVEALGLGAQQCRVIATAYDVYMGLMQRVISENNRLKQQAGGGCGGGVASEAGAAGPGVAAGTEAAAKAYTVSSLAGTASSAPTVAAAGAAAAVAAEATAGGLGSQGAASLAELASASYPQHMAMLRCMLANFARHSSAVMWLASLVFGRLLTEVQFAKLCLHSWPYLPCGQSLMRLVAQRVQQEQQQGQVLSPQLSGAESAGL